MEDLQVSRVVVDWLPRFAARLGGRPTWRGAGAASGGRRGSHSSSLVDGCDSGGALLQLSPALVLSTDVSAGEAVQSEFEMGVWGGVEGAMRFSLIPASAPGKAVRSSCPNSR